MTDDPDAPEAPRAAAGDRTGGEQPPAGTPFTTGNAPTGIGRPDPSPHPRPDSLVGSYVYSYDVATPSRPSPATATRSIPNMRPSYDAEHPVSPTPIYDALYSEYRRLFRALPGDRSGEENMRFTGFAVREPQPPEALSYPQQQAFQTYPGHTQGTPQYMPAQTQHSANGAGWVAAGYLGPAQPAAGAGGGRHRSMLSLPPGRTSA